METNCIEKSLVQYSTNNPSTAINSPETRIQPIVYISSCTEIPLRSGDIDTEISSSYKIVDDEALVTKILEQGDGSLISSDSAGESTTVYTICTELTPSVLGKLYTKALSNICNFDTAKVPVSTIHNTEDKSLASTSFSTDASQVSHNVGAETAITANECSLEQDLAPKSPVSEETPNTKVSTSSESPVVQHSTNNHSTAMDSPQTRIQPCNEIPLLSEDIPNTEDMFLVSTSFSTVATNVLHYVGAETAMASNELSLETDLASKSPVSEETLNTKVSTSSESPIVQYSTNNPSSATNSPETRTQPVVHISSCKETPLVPEVIHNTVDTSLALTTCSFSKNATGVSHNVGTETAIVSNELYLETDLASKNPVSEETLNTKISTSSESPVVQYLTNNQSTATNSPEKRTQPTVVYISPCRKIPLLSEDIHNALDMPILSTSFSKDATDVSHNVEAEIAIPSNELNLETDMASKDPVSVKHVNSPTKVSTSNEGLDNKKSESLTKRFLLNKKTRADIFKPNKQKYIKCYNKRQPVIPKKAGHVGLSPKKLQKIAPKPRETDKLFIQQTKFTANKYILQRRLEVKKDFKPQMAVTKPNILQKAVSGISAQSVDIRETTTISAKIVSGQNISVDHSVLFESLNLQVKSQLLNFFPSSNVVARNVTRHVNNVDDEAQSSNATKCNTTATVVKSKQPLVKYQQRHKIKMSYHPKEPQ